MGGNPNLPDQNGPKGDPMKMNFENFQMQK